MNIIVVDESDNEIDAKPRIEVDKQGLRYRVSALWLTNSKGNILLARRAYTKTHDPGKWGPAVAGTVDEGESYKDNIIKEAEEELGITNIKLALGPKRKRDGKHKHFTQWFLGVKDCSESDFKIQTEEVAEINWFTKEELYKELKDNPDEFLASMTELVEIFKKI